MFAGGGRNRTGVHGFAVCENKIFDACSDTYDRHRMTSSASNHTHADIYCTPMYNCLHDGRPIPFECLNITLWRPDRADAQLLGESDNARVHVNAFTSASSPLCRLSQYCVIDYSPHTCRDKGFAYAL